MADADRLSALPNDVLRRVLSFAPAREAAASAILSRRWRPLWRRTSAINLDSRPYGEAERKLCSYSFATFYTFFRDAHAAVAAFRRLLNMRWDYHHEQKYEDHVGGSFGEAIDRFESLGSMTSAHREAVQIGGISELPDALANNCGDFSCLQESLRKVTLQFKAKETKCFQVQLAKFLVENAMALEEMHVDDGIRFWPDRLFHKVGRWRADAFRRKNLQQPDTAAGFRVYQLPSPVVDPKEEERSLYCSFR